MTTYRGRLRVPLRLGIILLIEAGIALSLIQFATSSTYHVTVCAQEYKAVQDALAQYMANSKFPLAESQPAPNYRSGASRGGCVHFPAAG